MVKRYNNTTLNLTAVSLIKQFFYNQKTSRVRRGILPGNSKSLWDAVKIAKNQNTPTLPDIMSVNEINIKKKDLPLEFAKFFSNKIAQITSTTQISNAVYNGTKKEYKKVRQKSL